MKKVIALLLTVCMMLGIMPLAIATDNTQHVHNEECITVNSRDNATRISGNCPVCGAVLFITTTESRKIVGSVSVCYTVTKYQQGRCSSHGIVTPLEEAGTIEYDHHYVIIDNGTRAQCSVCNRIAQ